MPDRSPIGVLVDALGADIPAGAVDGEVTVPVAAVLEAIAHLDGGTFERSHDFELIEPAPDGWRFLHNQFNDSGYFALWTSAPSGAKPHDHETRWLLYRRVDKRRFVGAWRELGSSEDPATLGREYP